MLNITKSYATVWQVTVDERRVRARVSSSRKIKDKNGGADRYVNSSWLATFVGEAVELAKNLKERDRIIINNATISCEIQVDKLGNKILDENGKTKYYTNLTIFSFEMNNTNTQSSKPNPQTGTNPPAPANTTDSEDLPF